MVPGYNPEAIYRIPTASDGFVKIPSQNLRPCVTDRPGMFVTGTAAGPMDIVDSIVMAGAAATETAAYLTAHQADKANAAVVSDTEGKEAIHA